MIDQVALVKHLHDEAKHTYLGIVTETEQRLGVKLARFADVEFTFPDYKKRTDNGQWPYFRRFPNLTAKPYWDLSEFPQPARTILARLENEYTTLYEEFKNGLRVSQGGFHGTETGYYGVESNWMSLDLFTEAGRPISKALERFPKLCGILTELAGLDFTSTTYFALMKPGVHLQPHCGGQNSYLRMHFALDIPPGDCGMRVGGIESRWQNGKTMFFDVTFVHEAWNRTGRDRYILLMRILHPQLSAQERAGYLAADERFMAAPVFKKLEELKARMQGVID